MNENAVITIGGERYELILTTKATKSIAMKYGGLDKLGGILANKENPGEMFADAVWLITLLANQSILIHNLKNPQDKKELLTEEHTELLTSPHEFIAINQAIAGALNAGMKRTVDSENGGGNDETKKKGTWK